jgi:uncharacterized phage infection (PIP) family protein YhgE
MTEEDHKRDREFLERVIDERERIYESRFKALEKLIDERDRLYDSRFKAAEIAVNAALAAQEKGTNSSFVASEKAIVKAEQAQKDYNERSNEFRGQLDDQAKTLMPRPETLSMFKGIEDKLENVQTNAKNELTSARAALNKSIDTINSELQSLRESRSEGGGKDRARYEFIQQKNWSTGVIVAIMLALLGIVLKFVKP